MPIIYDVKLEPIKIENSFRITWYNLSIAQKFDPGNVSIRFDSGSSNLPDI